MPSSLGQYRALVDALGFADLSDEALGLVMKQIERKRENLPEDSMGRAMYKTEMQNAIRLAGSGPFADGEHKPKYIVKGTVAAGFEGVREAFESNFATGKERDAQLAIYVQGALVVDLHGSNTEKGQSRAPPSGYSGDTFANCVLEHEDDGSCSDCSCS
jgi:hypothetical protein